MREVETLKSKLVRLQNQFDERFKKIANRCPFAD